ncbi:MAG: hypothetical protein R3E34_02760 [Rhodocyclaceae bacterium]
MPIHPGPAPICAAAATGGNIRLTVPPSAYLDIVVDKLLDAGCEIDVERDEDRLRCAEAAQAVGAAAPSAFPTDMSPVHGHQLPWPDTAVIRETILRTRFMHRIPRAAAPGRGIRINQPTPRCVTGVARASMAPPMMARHRPRASMVWW